MKTTVFENILNKEKFSCIDPRDIQLIDGVEFLKVKPFGKDRVVLVRKDSLKKVVDKVKSSN